MQRDSKELPTNEHYVALRRRHSDGGGRYNLQQVTISENLLRPVQLLANRLTEFFTQSKSLISSGKQNTQ